MDDRRRNVVTIHLTDSGFDLLKEMADTQFRLPGQEARAMVEGAIESYKAQKPPATFQSAARPAVKAEEGAAT